MNMTLGSHSKPPRVAIVTEWLTTVGGAEMVLREMLAVFPDADVFALIDTLSPKGREAIGLAGRPVRTTWMQKIPGIGRRYRQLLPLMPFAVRSHDLRGYDLVISSAHAVAHRARVPAGAKHLVYCHTPIRYAWDLRERYLEDAGLHRGVRGWVARALLDWIKRGDARAARMPDAYAVNSRYIRERVRRCYQRDATVIWPPVDTEFFSPVAGHGEGAGWGARGEEGFYVAASRMVAYKKIALIAEAFARYLPERRLVVIGDGPEMARVREWAGENVEVLGAQPREVLRDYLRRARGFVFAADEDFGILPVEAQACGTPVIAYGVGGATETVSEGETGVWFREQRAEAIAEAVGRFEGISFDANACRANAERFGIERFRREFAAWVTASLASERGAGFW